jgi:histidinol-phosphate aminotransferase
MDAQDPHHPARLSRRSFFGAAAGTAALTMLRGRDALARPVPAGQRLRDDYVGRLCYNENPLGPSPAALVAMGESLSLGHRYGDWYGESLRVDLATLHDVSVGQILAGCGATEMLNLCARALASPGKNVVIPNPSYNQFSADAEFYGADVRFVALDSDHRVNLTRMMQSVDLDTTAVAITNPNNPTATPLTYAEIENFVNNLPPTTTFIVDEAYHEYVHAAGYDSMMELVRQGKQVIVIRTFSKVFGLAGIRSGYLVGKPGVVSQIAPLQTWGTISRPASEGSRAALDDSQHITDTVALADQAKAYCFTAFGQMGLDYIPSEASFFMVDVGQPASQVASELAQRGIQVRTGWGMPNHLRVSTGNMTDMQNFITALQEILEIARVDGELPARTTAMYGNFPNPVEEGTRIVYSIADPARVRLQVFDIQGRLVRTLCDDLHGTGFYEATWDRTDERRHPVAPGCYYYRMSAGNHVETRRMIVF